MAQRTCLRLTLLAAALAVAACTSKSMTPPAGTTGSAGASLPVPGRSGAGQSGSQSGSGQAATGKAATGKAGSAGPGAGQSGAGASPGASPASGPAAGTAAGAGGDDPAAVFDKSLGDFDGEISRERDEIAKAGQGSGRAAENRQASDTTAVKSAGRSAGGPDVGLSGPPIGAGLPGIGGVGGIGSVGGIGGETTGRSGGAAGRTPGTPGGDESGDAAGGGTSGTPGTAVADLPADIPKDGSGEDQVAKQLREAAMAESDPKIREALWDEYRKVMGIRKK